MPHMDGDNSSNIISASTEKATDQQQFPFFKLPPELRNKVYGYSLKTECVEETSPNPEYDSQLDPVSTSFKLEAFNRKSGGAFSPCHNSVMHRYVYNIALLRTCRSIYLEAFDGWKNSQKWIDVASTDANFGEKMRRHGFAAFSLPSGRTRPTVSTEHTMVFMSFLYPDRPVQVDNIRANKAAINRFRMPLAASMDLVQALSTVNEPKAIMIRLGAAYKYDEKEHPLVAAFLRESEIRKVMTIPMSEIPILEQELSANLVLERPDDIEFGLVVFVVQAEPPKSEQT